MARIEPRPTTDPKAWRVSWRLDGKRAGAWQSVTFADEKAAEKAAALVKAHGHRLTREQLHAILAPKGPVAGRTVADVCSAFVESLSIAASTRKEYERTVRLHVAPTPLGRMDVAEAGREDVRRWVRELTKAGLSPKSVANHHALVFAAFKDAVNDGLVSRNPCDGVRLPRRDHRTDANDEACFLTADEVQAIAEALPAKWRHIPWLLARTGLRWSELTALQVGDVDLQAKPPKLSVRRAWKRAAKGMELGPPKTRMSRRDITLDAACFDLLMPLVKDRTPSAFVITTDGAKPLSHSTFDRHWRNALYGKRPKKGPRAGGLVGEGLLKKRPKVHDLRHTHASWLLDDPRVTMIRLQRRMGHESLLTTEKVYGHVRRGADEAILAALDDIKPGKGADVVRLSERRR